MMACVALGWPARSLAWHPSGTTIAVGFMEAVKGGVAKRPKRGDKKGGIEAGGGDDDALHGEHHTGAVHLYSFQVVEGVVELRKRAVGCTNPSWIRVVQWSPDGLLLGVGAADKHLLVYMSVSSPCNLLSRCPLFPLSSNLSLCRLPPLPGPDSLDDEWEEVQEHLADKPKSGHNPAEPKHGYVFDKHSSAILHMDFSLDGLYCQVLAAMMKFEFLTRVSVLLRCLCSQSNCQAYELLFHHVDGGNGVRAGKQQTSATAMADYFGEPIEGCEDRRWASQTCILGWPCQGIWPKGAKGSDINALDTHGNRRVLATADDSGKVRIINPQCES